MSDFYLNDLGDINITSNGDIALCETPWRNYSQQAYLRIMTELGDFTMYPGLGANLESLMGMPNTPRTGEIGKNLILDALNRESAFAGLTLDVKAIPVSLDAIRFDIYITAGSRTEMILSIEQSLTPLTALQADSQGNLVIEGDG